MVGVEQWAEIRRMHRVERRSIREIHRLTGLHRATIRRAVVSDEPPRYRRVAGASKLDRFKLWIEEQLRADPTIPSKRLRELAEELGYVGGKTIFDDYVREIRPRFLRRRTYQRTLYRPGELLQFDLFEPREPIPVGHGQTRRGWVVTAELAGRGRWPGRWCSPAVPDWLGMSRCLGGWGAARAAAGTARPRSTRRRSPQRTVRRLLRPARGRLDHPRRGRCRGQGLLERSHRFMRTDFEPGRRFANELDYQAQLDAWTDRANARTHRTTRASPRNGWPRSAGGSAAARADARDRSPLRRAARSSPI